MSAYELYRDQVIENYPKVHDMLCRVSNELNDPTGCRWCDNPGDDELLLKVLCEAVDELLEKL